jgi:flagellar FliL protein
MASNTAESPRGAREPAKAPAKTPEDAKPADAEEKAESPPAKSGVFKPWLPLAVAVVAMPALAFATTHFVLLPKLQRGLAAVPPAAQESTTESVAAGKGKGAAEKLKTTVTLNKMLVNVAGTMGTRYLMTSVTLAGSASDFAGKINDNKDQLLDLATGVLGAKTISDLEKPGARNVIRAELLTVFNNALGGPVIQEIYITEMAIQ